MATVVSVAAVVIIALVAVVLFGGSLPRPGAPKADPFRTVRNWFRAVASIVGSIRRANATVRWAQEVAEKAALRPFAPKPAPRRPIDTKETSNG